jgi:hypothetical protein
MTRMVGGRTRHSYVSARFCRYLPQQGKTIFLKKTTRNMWRMLSVAAHASHDMQHPNREHWPDIQMLKELKLFDEDHNENEGTGNLEATKQQELECFDRGKMSSDTIELDLQSTKEQEAFMNTFLTKIYAAKEQCRKAFRPQDAKTIKDYCRKKNLMMQIKQPVWKQMFELKGKLDEINQIHIDLKREEGDRSPDADFNKGQDGQNKGPDAETRAQTPMGQTTPREEPRHSTIDSSKVEKESSDSRNPKEMERKQPFFLSDDDWEKEAVDQKISLLKERLNDLKRESAVLEIRIQQSLGISVECFDKSKIQASRQAPSATSGPGGEIGEVTEDSKTNKKFQTPSSNSKHSDQSAGVKDAGPGGNGSVEVHEHIEPSKIEPFDLAQSTRQGQSAEHAAEVKVAPPGDDSAEIRKDTEISKQGPSSSSAGVGVCGPVGEYPLHCCFLLGLHELGAVLIEKIYNTPERLSIPYKNDLDPWRRQGIKEEEGIAQSRPQHKEHHTTEKVTESEDLLDDGLYTGETILHIAIVQEKPQIVHKLLEQGIEICSRARGVFFQPRYRLPSIKELTRLQKWEAMLVGIDLEHELFAAVKKIENTFSECYYGEYPLSFAASVGNVEICKLLHSCWQRRVEFTLQEFGIYEDGAQDGEKKVLCKMTGLECKMTVTGLECQMTEFEKIEMTELEKFEILNIWKRGNLSSEDASKISERIEGIKNDTKCSIQKLDEIEILEVLKRKGSLAPKKEREICKKIDGFNIMIDRINKSSTGKGMHHPPLFRTESCIVRNSHVHSPFGIPKQNKDKKCQTTPSNMENSQDMSKPGGFPKKHRTVCQQLIWNFVNATDHFGNTAMHMAVLHNQLLVIDWLMTVDGGKDSLEMLNHEGFTPLTLAARYGKVEVFNHILYRHMSETAWTYGKVSCNAALML